MVLNTEFFFAFLEILCLRLISYSLSLRPALPGPYTYMHRAGVEISLRERRKRKGQASLAGIHGRGF